MTRWLTTGGVSPRILQEIFEDEEYDLEEDDDSDDDGDELDELLEDDDEIELEED